MIAEQKHQYTVLYIEDNPANLRLVAQLLGCRADIQMLTAIEPLQGLELAATHKPDLIYIGGDVVHGKLDTSPEETRLVANFFLSLSKIAPTIVILSRTRSNTPWNKCEV